MKTSELKLFDFLFNLMSEDALAAWIWGDAVAVSEVIPLTLPMCFWGFWVGEGFLADGLVGFGEDVGGLFTCWS